MTAGSTIRCRGRGVEAILVVSILIGLDICSRAPGAFCCLRRSPGEHPETTTWWSLGEAPRIAASSIKKSPDVQDRDHFERPRRMNCPSAAQQLGVGEDWDQGRLGVATARPGTLSGAATADPEG